MSKSRQRMSNDDIMAVMIGICVLIFGATVTIVYFVLPH